jgi:DNA-binding response OmpR family regulator
MPGDFKDSDHAPLPADLGRVLVVDDAETIGKILQRMLNTLGVVEVDHAGDAEAARRLMDAHSYGLVLLDVEMERTSGLDLLKAIRSSGRHGDLPVIMMTASRKTDYIVSAFAEADAYLLKPFSSPGLRAKIVEAVAKRRARAGG